MSSPTRNVDYWVRDDGSIVYKHGKVFYVVTQEFIDRLRGSGFRDVVVSFFSALPTVVCGVLWRHGVVGLPLFLAVLALGGLCVYAIGRRAHLQFEKRLAAAEILREPFDPYGLADEGPDWSKGEDGKIAYRSNWKAPAVFLTKEQAGVVARCKSTRSGWQIGSILLVLFADGYWWSGRVNGTIAFACLLVVVVVNLVVARRLRRAEALIVAASMPAPDEAIDAPRMSPRERGRAARHILISRIIKGTGIFSLVIVTIAVSVGFVMASYGLYGLLQSFHEDQGRGIPLGPIAPTLAWLGLAGVLFILVSALFGKLKAPKRQD